MMSSPRFNRGAHRSSRPRTGRGRWLSPIRVCGAAAAAALIVAAPVVDVEPRPPEDVGPRPAAQADAIGSQPTQLFVIGDSIARAYDNKPGSVRQGFWSMLANEIDAQPKMAAQGGAGFVKPGLSRCKGRTFAQQLARPKIRDLVANAGVLIIEGGRNDTRTCHKRGFADVTTEQLRAAVDEFMREAAALRAGSSGCTLVVVPWGPKGQEQRSRITPVIEKSAKQHGLDFIDTTGVLNIENTSDGVHPDLAGNVALTQEILRRGIARKCDPQRTTPTPPSVIDRPAKSGQRRFPI